MSEVNKEKATAKSVKPRITPRFRRAKKPEQPKVHSDLAGLKLLVTVVNRNKAEFYTDLLSQYEVNTQCTIMGMGTAVSQKARYLSLPDKEKAVIFSFIREDRASEILSVLAEKFQTVRNGKGVAYTIPFSGIIGVASYQFLANNRMMKGD